MIPVAFAFTCPLSSTDVSRKHMRSPTKAHECFKTRFATFFLPVRRKSSPQHSHRWRKTSELLKKCSCLGSFLSLPVQCEVVQLIGASIFFRGFLLVNCLRNSTVAANLGLKVCDESQAAAVRIWKFVEYFLAECERKNVDVVKKFLTHRGHHLSPKKGFEFLNAQKSAAIGFTE